MVCLLFLFGIELRRRNPFLIFAGSKKHFFRLPGNFTPGEEHLGKAKAAGVKS